MSDEAELISIIVPVYNRENTIERAVESVFRQGINNWELILVDDGSTDSSGKICDSYMQRDSRIKVFHTENQGVSHARNVGLDNARGEWIAFLDSDDEYYPDALKVMLKNSSDADIVISSHAVSSNYSLRAIKINQPVNFTLHSEIAAEAYSESLFATVWGKLFKKSLITDIRFDEKLCYAEDSLFFLDAATKANYIRYVPFLTYLYKIDSEKSLEKVVGLRKLDSLNRYLVKTLELFSDERIIHIICCYYAYSIVDWFCSVIKSEKLSDINKQITIDIALNDYVNVVSPLIRYNPVSDIYDEIWNTIISCDYEEIARIINDRIKAKKTREKKEELIPQNIFSIRIAEVNVEIKHRYDLIKEKCRDYIVSDTNIADISTYAPYERIEYSKNFKLKYDNEVIDNDYAEYDALPYQFYGELPKFDAFWLHSVVIEKDGEAYAFSAQPGVGKSTHAALWLKAFPDAHIINGDNPIIRLNSEDGKFYAYGTPFCGKEGYNENRGVPLKAVCFLERGEKNEIHRVKPEFVLVRLMRDNFCITHKNGEAHYNLYRKFTEKTKFYSLSCNMDIEAAEVAYKGLTEQ